MRLSGKRTVITGGNRGIGAGIARAFVKEGARVCINTLEPVAASEYLIGTLNSINANSAKAAFAYQADVRDETQINELFDFAAREMSGVDILVNNAGVESVISACELPAAEWDRICDTNLRGVFLCSQSACKVMSKQDGGGVIVNISSIHEAVPRLGNAHYAATKAGVSMLTKSLALEWAEFRIRVVGIAPGAVETEINREVINRIGRNRFERWIPLGRLGSIDDIAASAVFLSSDVAGYISGATLTVDGGYTLNAFHYDPRKAVGDSDEME